MAADQAGPWKIQLTILNLFSRRHDTGGSAFNFNDTLSLGRPWSAQVTAPRQPAHIIRADAPGTAASARCPACRRTGQGWYLPARVHLP